MILSSQEKRKAELLTLLIVSGCSFDSSDSQYSYDYYRPKNTMNISTKQKNIIYNAYQKTKASYETLDSDADAKQRAYEKAKNEGDRKRLKAEWESQKKRLDSQPLEIETQQREIERQRRQHQQSNQYNQQRLAAQHHRQAQDVDSSTQQENADYQRAIEESRQTAQAEERQRQRQRQQEEMDLQQDLQNAMQQQQPSQAQIEHSHPINNNQVPQSSSSADWEPNSGHMYEAGRYVMDLQRELGRTPSHDEMKSSLAEKMSGLTSTQINQIMSDMGLF